MYKQCARVVFGLATNSSKFNSEKLTSSCASDCRESRAETITVGLDSHVSSDIRRGRVARVWSLVVDSPVLWHSTFIDRV